MTRSAACIVLPVIGLATVALAQDVPPDVLAKIRAPIAARYPDNYSMQKTRSIKPSRCRAARIPNL